jgi:GntR family transcriptional regulator
MDPAQGNSHDPSSLNALLVKKKNRPKPFLFYNLYFFLTVYYSISTQAHMRFPDFESTTPLFQQIVAFIESEISSQKMRPGEFISSVREFAGKYQINPNTVSKGYQILQDRGLVIAVRGQGLAITEEGLSKANAAQRLNLKEKIKDVLSTAKAMGITRTELAEMILKEKKGE